MESQDVDLEQAEWRVPIEQLKRRQKMQAWADYLQLVADEENKIVPIRATR